MFEFLVEDALEALTLDLKQHGSYQPATLKEIAPYVRNSDQLDKKLKELGFPSVKNPKAKVSQPVPVSKPDYPKNLKAPTNNSAAVGSSVSEKQRIAISYILDYHDRRPIRAKLKDIDVTTSTYSKWLEDDSFQTLLRKELDKRFRYLDIDAKLSLSKLILEGDLQAIKYYYEFTGLYRPSNETSVNLTVILAKLMDVLVRHVEPETLTLIGDAIEREILTSHDATNGNS